MTNRDSADAGAPSGATQQYVTVRIGPQLFGIPIDMVHEVFVPQAITRVPHAPPAIEGVLNLRGRIVTMVNMRRHLGLTGETEAGAEHAGDATAMAVGIEHQGESFGLMIDRVGEVLSLDTDRREANPPNLDPRWTSVSRGVHRLANELMLLLNVKVALDDAGRAKAGTASRRH